MSLSGGALDERPGKFDMRMCKKNMNMTYEGRVAIVTGAAVLETFNELAKCQSSDVWSCIFKGTA